MHALLCTYVRDREGVNFVKIDALRLLLEEVIYNNNNDSVKKK